MDTEPLAIAAHNLIQARRWYRDIQFELSRGRRVPAYDEREATDACIFYSRIVLRELDELVDARRALRS